MAQPLYAIEYIGSSLVNGGDVITSASIKTTYPTATVLIMKTEGVSVSVDGGVMFPIEYGDQSYLVTGHTYLFSKDCIVAVGIYKVVT